MARPTKLTDAMQKAILEGIRLGLTYERSAEFSGITGRTFYNWKARGEKAKSGRYFQFVHALKKAEIEGETECLRLIKAAAQEPRHWQASAWLLERRYPDRYGKRIRQDIYDARQPVIELVKNGTVTFEQAENEFGSELARELFATAGVVVAEGRETEAGSDAESDQQDDGISD